jgi:hypothetical protein
MNTSHTVVYTPVTKTVRVRYWQEQASLRTALEQIDADLEARRRAEEEAAWAWYERQRQDGGKRR